MGKAEKGGIMQLDEEKERRRKKGFLNFLMIFGGTTFVLVLLVVTANVITKKAIVPRIGVAESAATEVEEPGDSTAPAEPKNGQKELGKLLPIPGYDYLYYSKGPGIVYIRMNEGSARRGYGYLTPFYSKNGNLYQYENGFFKELQ